MKKILLAAGLVLCACLSSAYADGRYPPPDPVQAPSVRCRHYYWVEQTVLVKEYRRLPCGELVLVDCWIEKRLVKKYY